MNKVLYIILISIFSLIVFSCAKEEEEEKVEALVIAEVTAVTTPTTDTTPSYTFSSSEAGTIWYGGSCSSWTTSATSGNNTILFKPLSDGTYSDCSIIVTDSDGNASNTLAVTTFVVGTTTTDTTAPVIAEVTPVRTPTTDTTPDYTFSSTKAGTISYGGSCSSNTTINISGNNTITLNSLSYGTYSDCIIVVRGAAGDVSNTLTMTSFTVSSTSQMGGAIQGRELSLSTAVTTFAGSSSGSTDATGTSASFNSPMRITTDGTNLYVTDENNNRIRKIVISTGVVTTLAGSSSGFLDNATGTSAKFSSPMGITTDGTNLYVADYGNHRIRKIVISTGVVTTLAGGSSSGSRDNATGTSASFNNPIGITTDGTNLYVADYRNHRIRKIVISTGVVTTFAGSSSGSTDATGTSAKFASPRGITTDGTNLYVADSFNHRIRKIVIDNGTVTTLAGSSYGFLDNATGTSAKFSDPRGITTDGTNLYVADSGNNRIRKIVISTGVVTTLAGGSSSGSTDNATGTSAKFNYPRGITTDGTNLYVADYTNYRIRKIE